MDSIGRRLKKAREAKRLNQVEVFKLTGINNKTLSRYENNGTEPDADSLKRLSSLYGVTTDWIIGIKKEGDYPPLENVYDQIINEVENEYKVNLRDDPIVLDSMRELIRRLAQMKGANK